MRLSPAGLDRLVERARERLSQIGERRAMAFTRRVERLRSRFGEAARLLDVVSYRSILERGFALVSDVESHAPIRSAAGVADGKALDIEFHDGHVRAVSGGSTAPQPRKRQTKKDGGAQGSLL